MLNKLRKIAIPAGAAILLALVLLFVYFSVLPRVSYRRLVNSVVRQDAVISACVVRGGEELQFTDKQVLAVISWLAEYRSENEGVKHAEGHSGYELRLDFADPGGRSTVLYVEPRAIVFPGIMGDYRIEVETNDIYSLITNINEV